MNDDQKELENRPDSIEADVKAEADGKPQKPWKGKAESELTPEELEARKEWRRAKRDRRHQRSLERRARYKALSPEEKAAYKAEKQAKLDELLATMTPDQQRKYLEKKKLDRWKVRMKYDKNRPVVIRVKDLGVRYHITEGNKVDTLKEAFIRMTKGKLKYKDFWALRHVSFEVKKGDRVAILGVNGAGKSTLLKLISGVQKPTEGTIETKGEIVPLLELGAGFDRDYTGGENIYLYGTMLGNTRKYMEERYDAIVEFSELGEFIDVPMKNYSSGMKARLGFAIATQVQPKILLLDEILSVGDGKFKRKSLTRIREMIEENGVTLLFVTHSLAQVTRLCNKAIILDHGEIVMQGPLKKVLACYEREFLEEEPGQEED